MNLSVVSVNYTISPIEILEKCACNKDVVTAYLSSLLGTMFFSEMVIISTCNRTEWVIMTPDAPKALDVLYSKIQEKSNVAISILKAHSQVFYGIDAMTHLFQVTCGLKSMVLGENEILTQVKNSFAMCQEFGATSAYLNKFFQLLVATGKEVRTVTNISKGAHSISSIAIEAIREIDQKFINQPMLLIGAGVMIQRALAKLVAIGHNDLWIANRTMSKADALADIYPNLNVISYASIKRELFRFSTVYVGVYSSDYIFDANDFKHFSDSKILVDVSLPRCIDPKCETFSHIKFISVDKLEAIANHTLQSREAVIPHVHACIRVALSEFNDWLAYKDQSIDWVNERILNKTGTIN